MQGGAVRGTFRTIMMADNLHQVLESYEQERIQLEESFLNQALVAATLNDNHECIAKLVKMGARNIDECIQLAKKRESDLVKAKAMLSLVKAALTGEKALLPDRSPSKHSSLDSELNSSTTSTSSVLADDSEVAKVVQSGEISTLIPLELAQQSGQHSMRREILMLTRIDRSKGHVDWSKLSLVSLDVQLLGFMQEWVKEFKLPSNMLRSVPAELKMLKELTCIDLSDNELTTVPIELIQLPNLKTLDLSHNKIDYIPYTRKVSLSLINLDLSDNRLSSLPLNLSAPVLTVLNISKNQLTHVPLCICTFQSLISLDLSGNSIVALPYEMGMLTKLVQLNLSGLKRLRDPPRYVQNTCRDCIGYLREKLQAYVDGSYCTQLMIVGDSGSGKHTLSSRLHDKRIKQQLHEGIHISEWECRPSGAKRDFQFRTWIFDSLDDYTATHQCFLHQSSLYLLLFNLKQGNEGVHELKSWLNSITRLAPRSGIVIIGTHSDEVPQHDVGLLLQQAEMVAAAYGKKLKTVALISVDLKHTPGNVLSIQETILQYAVNYPVLQEAIMREIYTNGERVMELLNSAKGSLDAQFFKEALRAAIEMDSDINIGLLALSGPIDISECIKFAEKEEKSHARALLMLIQAAETGGMNILSQLDLKTVDKENFDDTEAKFPLIHSSQLLVNISPTVPIEIARRKGHSQVREEMILKTNVHLEERKVYWSRMQLKNLEVSWMSKISWVERLKLDRNGLTVIPSELSQYLQQIVKLDLQRNNLSVLPRFIFELPNLQDLNLSHNQLEEIPAVPEWSFCMTSLNLFDNKLTSLPPQITALSLLSLNIGSNKFSAVPLSICSFTTLQSLDLSNNPDITILPTQMGQLSFLSHLNLKGLKKLRDPPRSMQTDCNKCIGYLNEKFKRFTPFYGVKLMVVGHSGRGKTTLISRLVQGREDVKKSGAGLNMSKWLYRPSVARRTFHFNIWDFDSCGKGESCYNVHQCFFSQNAIYLVLFNLLHGKKAVEELSFWLNSIAFRAPQSCVIVIGTHLDQIADESRGPGEGDALLRSVSELAAVYKNRLLIIEILPVALENRIENISLLKEAIYNHAAKYKNDSDQLIMGQRVPTSYLALVKQLDVVREEVKQRLREPIMHVKDFKSMVNEMCLTDIVDNDSELKKVSIFLTETSSLLHCDERGHNLHELYFVDPSWLYEVICDTVIKGRRRIAKNGILLSEDFNSIMQERSFPMKYVEQYIALLDRFEIALALDNRRLLIPSELPKEKKFGETKEHHNFYSRHFVFSSASPPGLWSRLLIHSMYTVEKISLALDNLVPVQQYNDNHTDVDHPSSTPDLPENATRVLPNFLQPRSLELLHSFNPSEVQLECWQAGLYYSDPEVTFKIQYLPGGKRSSDHIVVAASRNSAGIVATSQLIDVIMSLVREWYRLPNSPGHKHESSGLKQVLPCFECTKLGRSRPHEFNIEQCLQAIVNDQTSMECSYFQSSSKKNHSVAIEDIAPDLLFQDIDPDCVLHPEDIAYQENDESLLGKGGYAEVYQGVFKDSRSIAAKKYLSRYSEQVLCELHFEAKMHCRFKHPCIIDFIGVCFRPLMVLLVEKAPLNSAASPFLEGTTPISRLTVFRIATEVASALQYMHCKRIIYRDVKLANVLLWSLDPDSLCHCKVCDLNIAADLSPTGVRGLRGCKGFTAPELMHTGKGKQCSLYDHKADVFSYGMFLYQMIARRHPYHNIPTNRIDVAVEKGERPKLQDNSSYCCLTELMEKCWDDNPTKRPEMKEIVKSLCLSSMQMIMCMIPIQSRHSLRQALSVSKIESGSQNLLWVCCDSVEGVEIRAYNIHTMAEIKKIFVQDNQVQCMTRCGDHVWIVTRAGIEYRMIDIRSAATMDSVHKIHFTQNRSITCITANSETVYIGTNDGYCVSYDNDSIKLAKENHISECAIDGIACIDGSVWISHADKVSYLDLETLEVKGTIALKSSPQQRAHHVGQLSHGVDHIMWGAHMGGILLSAWNTQAKCHLYNIDTAIHMERIAGFRTGRDLALITTMTPVLDTVWVGMASGHILIFHKDQLISWFHLFEDYVHFLTCIPPSSLGHSGAGKCMVASGGKNVKPQVPLCKPELKNGGISSQVVIWEAYDAKTMRQIMLIEERSPGHLDNHDTVRRLIKEGNFKDGTNLGSIPFHDRTVSIAGFDPIYTNCPIGEEEGQTGATE